MKGIKIQSFLGIISKFKQSHVNKILLSFTIILNSQAVLAVVVANNSTTYNISGAATSSQYYSLSVPAGAANLSIVISGPTGDADLFVKYGSVPTITTYDFRPYLASSNETVTIPTPSVGSISHYDSRLYYFFGCIPKSFILSIRYKSCCYTSCILP